MDQSLPVSASSPAPSPTPAPSGWEAFERGLASALGVLKDEFLVVSTKAGNRFVQFDVRPDRGIWAEATSNSYLSPDERLDVGQLSQLLSLGWSAPTHAKDAKDPVPPPDGSSNHFREFPLPYSCADVARFAVRTLTEALRVASPAELEYRSFDDAGNAVTLPPLPIPREAAHPPRVKEPPRKKGPSPFDRLRAKVLTAARNGSGLASLEYEDDVLLVPIGSRMGWIRPVDAPHYVRVHLHLASDVAGTEELLAKIAAWNARLPMARIIYKGRSVFFAIDFPAAPFRAEHLSQAVTALAHYADDVVKDLGLPGDAAQVSN